MYIYNFIYMEVFITFRHLQIPPPSLRICPLPTQTHGLCSQNNPEAEIHYFPSFHLPDASQKEHTLVFSRHWILSPGHLRKLIPEDFQAKSHSISRVHQRSSGLTRTLVWRESCFSPLLHLSVFIPPFCFLPLFFLLPFLLVFKHLFLFLPFPFQSFLCIVLSSYPSLWFSNSFSVSLWDQRIS